MGTKRFSKMLPPLKAGSLEVRLAQSDEDVDAAQRLRYEVFYEECGAQPDALTGRLKSDVTHLDNFCDILLVIDHDTQEVVGTYRFLLREAAQEHGGYYTANEFNITALIKVPGQIMELGRSCVKKPYRTRPTMQLLWKGIGAYIKVNHVSLCFGCASFLGTNIEQYDQALSYLYYYHLAPPELRAYSLPQHYQKMDLLPFDKVQPKEALRQLPPLIKAYLRVGAFIGDGAYVDHQFNSIDVCIIVQRERVANRYSQRYATTPHIGSNVG